MKAIVLAYRETYDWFIADNGLRRVDYRRIDSLDAVLGYAKPMVMLDLCDVWIRTTHELLMDYCRSHEIDVIKVRG